jgi:hypothetical protein
MRMRRKTSGFLVTLALGSWVGGVVSTPRSEAQTRYQANWTSLDTHPRRPRGKMSGMGLLGLLGFLFFRGARLRVRASRSRR